MDKVRQWDWNAFLDGWAAIFYLFDNGAECCTIFRFETAGGDFNNRLMMQWCFLILFEDRWNILASRMKYSEAIVFAAILCSSVVNVFENGKGNKQAYMGLTWRGSASTSYVLPLCPFFLNIFNTTNSSMWTTIFRQFHFPSSFKCVHTKCRDRGWYTWRSFTDKPRIKRKIILCLIFNCWKPSFPLFSLMFI